MEQAVTIEDLEELLYFPRNAYGFAMAALARKTRTEFQDYDVSRPTTRLLTANGEENRIWAKERNGMEPLKSHLSIVSPNPSAIQDFVIGKNEQCLSKTSMERVWVH